MTHPFAPVALPSTLATFAAFLPAAAALWKRRSPSRDVAGQVALCWLVMAVVGSVGFVRFHVLGLTPQFRGNGLVAALFLALLLPPSSSWIGRERPISRWRWWIVGAWIVLWAVANAGLVDERSFRTAIDPLMAGFMVVVSGWAMAEQVRRTSVAVARTDWFWILLGHIVYFMMTMVRLPLTEVLSSYDRKAAMIVHTSFMLLYIAAYVLIARGMMIRTRTDAPAPVRSISMPQVA